MQGVACYKALDSKDETVAFVEEHSYLIHKMARYIKSTIPHHLDFDDLLQSGLVGLLEAKSSFQEDGGASFKTYATLKIRYAIYEGIRKGSGITREISQNIKKITLAMTNVEQRGTLKPSSKDLAAELGVSLQKYSEITKQINTYRSINTNESDLIEEPAGENDNNPLNLLEIENAKSNIKEIVRELPKREQILLALYYNEQMNFKEIAGVMELTEARISQLHSQAITKLKRKLTRNVEVLL